MRLNLRLILLGAALAALALHPAAFAENTDVQNGLLICRRLADDATPGDAKRADADFERCFAGLKPYLEPGFVPATPDRR